MSQEKAKKIKFLYGWVFGIASILLAFLLILQVCDIYFNGGTNPYTVESIKEHFFNVLWYIILWGAIAAVGGVLDRVFPTQEKTLKMDEGYILANLKKKLKEKEIVKDAEYQRLDRLQRIHGIVKFVCGVCVGICIVFGFAYLFNGENFPNQDQNKEAAKASLYLLPFVVTAFALCIFVGIYEKSLIKKQLLIVKSLLVTLKDAEEEKANEGKIKTVLEGKRTVNTLRFVVGVVGVTLLVYGLATGGNAGVLGKAITICRQCIGLG